MKTADVGIFFVPQNSLSDGIVHDMYDKSQETKKVKLLLSAI